MRVMVQVLAMLPLVLGCSKAAQSPPSEPIRKPGWTQATIDDSRRECNEQIEGLLSEPTRASTICGCWVDRSSVLYTPEDMNTDDLKILNESNSIFRKCATDNGEQLNLAHGAARFPSTDDRKPIPKLFQKTLDQLKEKNQRLHLTPPDPSRPSAPELPVEKEEKNEAKVTIKGTTPERSFVLSDKELTCTYTEVKATETTRATKTLLIAGKTATGEELSITIEPFSKLSFLYAHKGKAFVDPKNLLDETFKVSIKLGDVELKATDDTYTELKAISTQKGRFTTKLVADKLSGLDVPVSIEAPISCALIEKP
jgi:hypothetical protein